MCLIKKIDDLSNYQFNKLYRYITSIESFQWINVKMLKYLSNIYYFDIKSHTVIFDHVRIIFKFYQNPRHHDL